MANESAEEKNDGPGSTVSGETEHQASGVAEGEGLETRDNRWGNRLPRLASYLAPGYGANVVWLTVTYRW